MPLQEYIDSIYNSFPGDVYKNNIVNSNELYLEVNPDNILNICKYIYFTIESSLVSLFASDERYITGKLAVYYVFAIKKESVFIILKTLKPMSKPAFQSISNDIYSADLYEREIKDMFGLVPEGHPDPKRLVFHGNWPEGVYPLTKDFDSKKKLSFENKKIEFTNVEGAGVYEIPVGPVHAGIIEPGHFRFSVAGEPVINLEAQLFYTHKGIEKLSEGVSIEKCLYISERISGDETFANSLAYCQAIEKIAGAQIPARASYSRVLFAELERLVSHFGDLSGVCTDVAYGFAASQFNMLRNWTFQIIEEVCGSRFLRSVNKLGGVRKDFISGNENKIKKFMADIKKELIDSEKIIKSNSLFIDRVEHTGILKTSIAIDLNAVGPAGRASGIKSDIRKTFPYCAYEKLDFKIPQHNNGDVNCRINVKLEECHESIDLVLKVLESMPSGNISLPVAEVEPYKFALGYTESPRGENIHWVMTGEANTIFRYKIRTPSFCNWPALCHAVQGNIVPDFPLINKSFNLSYAGNDR